MTLLLCVREGAVPLETKILQNSSVKSNRYRLALRRILAAGPAGRRWSRARLLGR